MAELTKALEDSFEHEFWPNYPNKKSKGDAKKAWGQLKPDAALVEKIKAALMIEKRWRAANKGAGKDLPMWKYPATWIRAECWNDELEGTFGELAEQKAVHDQTCVKCGNEGHSRYEFGWICDPCWWKHMSRGDWRITVCRKASVRLGITKNTTLEDLRKMAKEEGKKARGRMTMSSNEDARSESLRRASKRD